MSVLSCASESTAEAPAPTSSRPRFFMVPATYRKGSHPPAQSRPSPGCLLRGWPGQLVVRVRENLFERTGGRLRIRTSTDDLLFARNDSARPFTLILRLRLRATGRMLQSYVRPFP